jgi:propanol-preferring alcohol dehydrogenase
LSDAALTPYHAVVRSMPLLVHGSTTVVIEAGGLGHMAVQILDAISPTRVVVVDSSKPARDLAEEVGAAHAIAPGPDAAAEIRELTGGVGADVVLDLVGVDATLQLGAAVSRSLGHRVSIRSRGTGGP